MAAVDQLNHMTDRAMRESRFAMLLSLVFGVVMLVGKGIAYFSTGSAAILSDASESVIHLFAVAFAAFSLWLSSKPANSRFTFGYERISFFSAGFEGALIILAASLIITESVEKLRPGIELQRLGFGTAIVAAAAILNAGLGLYLVRTGRRARSIILEANGQHVLTDSWTSFGVVAGLGLVMLTGWRPLDPICAIAVALNIVWSGSRLIFRSVSGLMDYANPETAEEIGTAMDQICKDLRLRYHGLRFRNTGFRLFIELHLLFPADVPLGTAHRLATELEERLPILLARPAEVVTHLEALEDHSKVHHAKHYTGKP
ncbi:MAG: cation diffusion facilitator family transporter [Acidobacteriota bacterium]